MAKVDWDAVEDAVPTRSALSRKKAAKEASDLFYRGTQTDEHTRTQFKQLSFTPCLGAALVYSAVPANAWSSSKELSKAHFVEGSTVTAVRLDVEPYIDWPYLSLSIGDVMRALKFEEPDGITEEEVRRIYNYMQNRILGKAAGGEFKYKLFDEDGDEMSDEDLEEEKDILTTGIAWARDNWDYDATLHTADCVAADTFIYADCPVVVKVAQRLGFRGIRYLDVFDAGYAVKDLFGIEDIFEIECVEQEEDIEWEEVPSHVTVRPLAGANVEVVWQKPALVVMEELFGVKVAVNRRKRGSKRKRSRR